MKKIIKIIIALIFLIIIIFWLNKPDNLKFKKEYEKYNNNKKYIITIIPKNNNIKYLNEKEALKIVKNGTGILYIGYPQNNTSRKIITELITIANQTQTQIYYYNPKTNKNEKLKKQISIKIPSVYFIMGGKQVGSYHLKKENHTTKKEIKKELQRNNNKIYGICDETCK